MDEERAAGAAATASGSRRDGSVAAIVAIRRHRARANQFARNDQGNAAAGTASRAGDGVSPTAAAASTATATAHREQIDRARRNVGIERAGTARGTSRRASRTAVLAVATAAATGVVGIAGTTGVGRAAVKRVAARDVGRVRLKAAELRKGLARRSGNAFALVTRGAHERAGSAAEAAARDGDLARDGQRLVDVDAEHAARVAVPRLADQARRGRNHQVGILGDGDDLELLHRCARHGRRLVLLIVVLDLRLEEETRGVVLFHVDVLVEAGHKVIVVVDVAILEVAAQAVAIVVAQRRVDQGALHLHENDQVSLGKRVRRGAARRRVNLHRPVADARRGAVDAGIVGVENGVCCRRQRQRVADERADGALDARLHARIGRLGACPVASKGRVFDRVDGAKDAILAVEAVVQASGGHNAAGAKADRSCGRRAKLTVVETDNAASAAAAAAVERVLRCAAVPAVGRDGVDGAVGVVRGDEDRAAGAAASGTFGTAIATGFTVGRDRAGARQAASTDDGQSAARLARGNVEFDRKIVAVGRAAAAAHRQTRGGEGKVEREEGPADAVLSGTDTATASAAATAVASAAAAAVLGAASSSTARGRRTRAAIVARQVVGVDLGAAKLRVETRGDAGNAFALHAPVGRVGALAELAAAEAAARRCDLALERQRVADGEHGNAARAAVPAQRIHLVAGRHGQVEQLGHTHDLVAPRAECARDDVACRVRVLQRVLQLQDAADDGRGGLVELVDAGRKVGRVEKARTVKATGSIAVRAVDNLDVGRRVDRGAHDLDDEDRVARGNRQTAFAAAKGIDLDLIVTGGRHSRHARRQRARVVGVEGDVAVGRVRAVLARGAERRARRIDRRGVGRDDLGRDAAPSVIKVRLGRRQLRSCQHAVVEEELSVKANDARLVDVVVTEEAVDCHRCRQLNGNDCPLGRPGKRSRCSGRIRAGHRNAIKAEPGVLQTGGCRCSIHQCASARRAACPVVGRGSAQHHCAGNWRSGAHRKQHSADIGDVGRRGEESVAVRCVNGRKSVTDRLLDLGPVDCRRL